MYRIRLPSGRESEFATIEELALALQRGEVSREALIYHRRSDRWVPVGEHPRFQGAADGSDAADAADAADRSDASDAGDGLLRADAMAGPGSSRVELSREDEMPDAAGTVAPPGDPSPAEPARLDSVPRAPEPVAPLQVTHEPVAPAPLAPVPAPSPQPEPEPTPIRTHAAPPVAPTPYPVRPPAPATPAQPAPAHAAPPLAPRAAPARGAARRAPLPPAAWRRGRPRSRCRRQ